MFGLLAKDGNVGGEASGSGGLPIPSTVEQMKVYKRVINDPDAEEKLAPMANKIEQKWKLTLDPMVESSWRSKEYSTLVQETVPLSG